VAYWAIGDIHGCRRAFSGLLKKIDFSSDRDELWLCGDIVNRGEDSLWVLDWVYSHRDNIKMVIGNHELHLLAAYYGLKSANSSLEALLESANIARYIAYLESLPLVHVDAQLGYLMAHAGLPPRLCVGEAKGYSNSYQRLIERIGFDSFYAQYKKQPHEPLYRAIRELTTMRYIDSESLEFDYSFKLAPCSSKRPKNLKPWYELMDNTEEDGLSVLFGHWSTLGFFENGRVYGLDSGCLWGGKLSAFNLETRQLRQVDCADYSTI